MKRCEVPVTAGSSRSTPSAPQQRHGMGSFFSWSGRWRRTNSTSKWGEGTLVMVSLPSSVGDDVMIPFLGETCIFQSHFFGWYRMISPHMTIYDQILYDHVNGHGCHGLQVTWGSGSSIVSQRRWWAWPSWNRKEIVRRERPWTSTRHGSTSRTGANASRHRKGGNLELQAILEEFFFLLTG